MEPLWTPLAFRLLYYVLVISLSNGLPVSLYRLDSVEFESLKSEKEEFRTLVILRLTKFGPLILSWELRILWMVYFKVIHVHWLYKF